MCVGGRRGGGGGDGGGGGVKSLVEHAAVSRLEASVRI